MWEKPGLCTLAGIAGLAIVVAGCTGLNGSAEAPQRDLPDEIAQSAAASDHGVTIEALGAAFSGTETLLRLNIAVEDDSDVLARIGRDGSIERVTISGTGYSGPFGGEPLRSTTIREGDVLLHLAALEVPADYDGEIDFEVSALNVFVDSRPVLLEGEWRLTLAGPHPSEIEERLRVEEFAPVLIELEGSAAEVSAVRSRSATMVTITLPEGILMVSPPTLRAEGEQLMPVTFDAEAAETRATFVPTPFGEEVELELGTLATARGSRGETISVAFSDVLEEADGAEEFDVPVSAILEGNPVLVLGGVQGEYRRGGRWVGLVLAGSWHPENSQPVFIDGRGVELELAHVQVGYARDAKGTIGDSTTNAAAFVGDDADLDRLTIVLGGQSTVDNSGHTAKLVPM
jgi:hypothetical protein